MRGVPLRTLASAFNLSSLRAVMISSQPSESHTRAMSLPIPELAPVIRTFFDIKTPPFTVNLWLDFTTTGENMQADFSAAGKRPQAVPL